MAENIEKNSNRSVANTVTKRESLCDISSSSLDAGTLSSDLELERIVAKTLGQLQAIPHFGDLYVNDLVDVIMPKIRSEVMGFDRAYNEVQNIRESLDTNLQQVQVVDQDIADIFLDLHNVYRKLEKLDESGSKLSSAEKGKLSRHVKAAEEFQNRSRHYLSNDPKEMSAKLVGPPKEPPSNPKVRDCLSKPKTPVNNRYQGGLIPYKRHCVNLSTELTERRTFLTNMIAFKKSDYSFQLNRFKTYFSDVQRAINCHE